ncbi:MAG: extracellular solute-binding protein [Clostridiales bacterium]|nr:extracellular solute-binding protein [Clostridiales bacterium]
MKKLLALVLSVCCLFTTVGCGGGGGGLEYDYTETNETIEYTFYSPDWQKFQGKENDRVLKHLEEKFNVSIKIEGASSSMYYTNLKNRIAGDNSPDMFFMQPDEASFSDYIYQEVVTDLNGYINKAADEESPYLTGLGKATNLKTILSTEQYAKTTLVNGKNYFIPQSVGYTTRIIIVRKDWMKEWNEGRGKTGDDVYVQPQTLSEFESMLTYFKTKTNAYGMQLSSNFDFLQDFFASFGIKPYFYLDSDGNYQLSATHDNYKTMLEWFHSLCSQGLLDPQFSTLSEDDALRSFYQGQVGLVVSSGDFLLDGIINELMSTPQMTGKEVNDVVTLITPPDSDDRTYKGAFRGWNFYWGGWCISPSAPEPMRLIRMLDYVFSPEGQKLMVYGVEGVHYTQEGDVITPNYTNRLADGQDVFVCPDTTKTNEPRGRYNIGHQLIPCPYIIDNNRLVINYPYDTGRDYDLMKLSYDLTYEETPNFDELSTIIADKNMAKDKNEILDSVIEYTTNVIVGTNGTQQELYSDLMSVLNQLDYLDLLDYLNQNNKIA